MQNAVLVCLQLKIHLRDVNYFSYFSCVLFRFHILERFKKQARKPRSYASSKLRLTDRLAGLKCRATSVVKKKTKTQAIRSRMPRVSLHPRMCRTKLRKDKDKDKDEEQDKNKDKDTVHTVSRSPCGLWSSEDHPLHPWMCHTKLRKDKDKVQYENKDKDTVNTVNWWPVILSILVWVAQKWEIYCIIAECHEDLAEEIYNL